MTTRRTAWTDRAMLARLAVRVANLRDTVPAGDTRSMVDLKHLSRHQLDLIAESLLGTLTALNLHGYAWFRDVPASGEQPQ